MKYWVDESDAAYITIRTEATASEYVDLVTLAEAKRHAIEIYQARIDHARAMIRMIRSETATYIQNEDAR